MALKMLFLFICITSVWKSAVLTGECVINDKACNVNNLSWAEMYRRGHLKPFGSHKQADAIVEALPFMISPEDFYLKYVAQHKPVIIKGVTKNWPAYKLWTDEYLLKKYGNASLRMELKNDDKDNVPPDQSFAEFLLKYKNNTNRYLVDDVISPMKEEVILPTCLRCDEMDKSFFMTFFWMSSGGTTSTVHLDTDENLLCVIKGHKKVIMVDPRYSKYLYADNAKELGVSPINHEAVDLDKFPLVTKIKYYEGQVEEGDAIYIPQMWWHQVYSRKERQQAIAFWWKSKPKTKSKDGSYRATLRKKETGSYSYADALDEYESWIQEVYPEVEPIKCSEQEIKMSAYDDSTGHESMMSHPPQHCEFKRGTQDSPCSYSSCVNSLHAEKCLQYILQYCKRHSDNACITQLPFLLHNLSKETYARISAV